MRLKVSSRAFRWSVVCATTLVWVGAWPGIGAQAADPVPTDLVAVAHGSVLEGDTQKKLRAAWHETQSDLSREAWLEASGRLRHLVEVRTDLGVPNIGQLSSTLLHAADEAASAGAIDAARGLADAAAVLSPTLAAPRFAKAGYLFRHDPLSVTDQIKELRSGFELLSTDTDAFMKIVGNALAACIYVIVLLSGLFSMAMFSRYHSFAGNDVRRFLPDGVTVFQSTLLLAVFMIAPLAAGLGLLVTITVWLVVLSLYMRPTERVAALLLLAAIAVVPAATRYVVRTINYPATPESVVERCNVSLCGPDDREWLREWATTNVLGYESNFTMALVLARDAGAGADTIDRAQQYARTASEFEETHEVLALLGNLQYLQGLRECGGIEAGTPGAVTRLERAHNEAVTLWNLALAGKRMSLAPLYNAHVALSQLGDHDKADPLLTRAMAVDTNAVLHWNKDVAKEANLVRCRMSSSGNRHVMSVPLPAERLRRSAMAQSVPFDGLLIPFSALVTGRLGTPFIGLAGLAGLALVVLLWFAVPAIRPTSGCTTCGSIADPRSRLDAADGAVCERCLLIDIRRAFVDAKEQWFREHEREVHAAKRARRARLVTWFLPGYGHLLRGAALRGVLFLGVVVTCTVAGLEFGEIVQDPGTPGGLDSGRLFIFGALAGVMWLIAVIDAHAAGVNS